MRDEIFDSALVEVHACRLNQHTLGFVYMLGLVEKGTVTKYVEMQFL